MLPHESYWDRFKAMTLEERGIEVRRLLAEADDSEDVEWMWDDE